jgi:uncharacterized protein YndB with AHSA1/START domain
MMGRNYTVSTHIRKPVQEVFDAVVSKDSLNKYFTNASSADLTEGDRIRWHWDHYGELSIVVNKIVANELIELSLDSKEWEKTKKDTYEVLVIFEFESTDDGGTKMSISEQGWRTDAEGLKGSHDNCSGWTDMAKCMKAWLEHGIDLR